MEGELKLAGLRGTLHWKGQGVFTVLETSAERREDGLYKVLLRGRGGGEMSLGTLVPEGGALRLCRRLPSGTLEASGCWPPVEVRAVRTFSFEGDGEWEEAGPLPPLLSDPVIRRAAEEVKGALLRRRRDGMELAVPFSPREPFPLVPLICLGRLQRIGGRRYLVFSLDGRGAPRVWR